MHGGEEGVERIMARIMNGRDALPGEYPWIVFIDNRAFETAVRKTIILQSTH